MQIFVWFIAFRIKACPEGSDVTWSITGNSIFLSLLNLCDNFLFFCLNHPAKADCSLKCSAVWLSPGFWMSVELRLLFWLPSSPSNRFHIITSPLTNNLIHSSFLFMPKVIIENNSYLSVYLWIFNSLLLIYSAYL